DRVNRSTPRRTMRILSFEFRVSSFERERAPPYSTLEIRHSKFETARYDGRQEVLMSALSIYPIMLAGGASSRLWPASGRERPRWALRLFGKRNPDGQTQSLLEGAWERARGVAPAANCFVVAGQAQAELIRRSLPELPASNLLIEPEPRDTSGAV